MADLSVHCKPWSVSTGEQYTQKTGTASDFTTAVAIVPAITNKRAVIDALIVSSTAAEIWTLMAGSDQLMQSFHTTALGAPVEPIPEDHCIRSDVFGEAIGLKAASSGAAFYTVWFHYETDKAL